MTKTRFFILMVVMTVILVSATSVLAKKKKAAPPPPAVVVLSRWTPQEQLVSITGDTRTVTLQMSARTTRQFWAMDLSCLVSSANIFDSTHDTQTMVWGSGWLAGDGTTHFDSTMDSNELDGGISYYDGATNRINASITRAGASNAPFGLNGVTYTELLFNLELQIAEGLVGTTAVTISCDKALFLDRNGVSLGTTQVSFLNTLVLRDGYSISGSVARQSNANKAEVDVTCVYVDDDTHIHTVVTQNNVVRDKKGNVIQDTSGQFSFNKAHDSAVDPLREFGWYECTFASELGGTEDPTYLQGTSFINLQTPNYTLQPITLRTGDTDPDDLIDLGDVAIITGNWNDTETAFTNGDVNGDGIVNGTDLAITAGNLGLTDATTGVMMDHILYSTARDYGGTFPNNTMAMGDVFSGAVRQLSSSRAYWPQVSPNGAQVAYYGTTARYYDKKGRLLSGPSGAVRSEVFEGIILANTASWTGSLLASGKGFAPSWSPSGSQIAYICSWEGIVSQGFVDIGGYEYNNGDLCVISTTAGSTPNVIKPTGAVSTYAEIFPPAWYDESTLIYAGNASHPLCPNQLCYYDMLTNAHAVLPINGVDGINTFANMPVIMRYSSGQIYLFYRYFTAGSSELHMGTVVYDSASNTWTGGVPDVVLGDNMQHELVDGTAGGVHYYDVSPMLDVMFYEFGDVQFHNRYFDMDTFVWSIGEDHMVDGFVGYPTVDETGTVWDGLTESIATDFHAFKATIDWLP